MHLEGVLNSSHSVLRAPMPVALQDAVGLVVYRHFTRSRGVVNVNDDGVPVVRHGHGLIVSPSDLDWSLLHWRHATRKIDLALHAASGTRGMAGNTNRGSPILRVVWVPRLLLDNIGLGSATIDVPVLERLWWPEISRGAHSVPTDLAGKLVVLTYGHLRLGLEDVEIDSLRARGRGEGTPIVPVVLQSLLVLGLHVLDQLHEAYGRCESRVDL